MKIFINGMEIKNNLINIYLIIMKKMLKVLSSNNLNHTFISYKETRNQNKNK
jgi:hypothetical protein